MSKLNINYETNEVDYKSLDFPVFLASGNCSLYQLIEKIDNTVSLVSIEGYEQHDCDKFESIEDFMNSKYSSRFRVVDIDINVK